MDRAENVYVSEKEKQQPVRFKLTIGPCQRTPAGGPLEEQEPCLNTGMDNPTNRQLMRAQHSNLFTLKEIMKYMQTWPCCLCSYPSSKETTVSWSTKPWSWLEDVSSLKGRIEQWRRDNALLPKGSQFRREKKREDIKRAGKSLVYNMTCFYCAV